MKKQAIELLNKYTKGDISTIININGRKVKVTRKGRKVSANEILNRN